MNIDRSVSILLVLLGSAFAICIIYLIPYKATWVDEMYTWYGIHHGRSQSIRKIHQFRYQLLATTLFFPQLDLPTFLPYP